MCDCISVKINGDNGFQVVSLQTAGQYNGENYWTFTYSGFTFFIYFFSGTCWFVSETLGGAALSRHCPTSGNICTKAPMSPNTASNDPVSMWNFITAPVPPFGNLTQFETEATTCPTCDQEDRTKKSFNSIKLPTDFVEQSRGIKDCCCKYLVLADPSSDTWKTDKTSAWIKVSDPSDTYQFKLYKDKDLANYTPTANQFPNDNEAYYTTINWMDVLTSDGAGCYELKIEYTISGITGSVSWGQYTLKPYSIQNALHTARIRAIFDSIQESENINFTGAEVESSLRFHGYIGNRQPNTETDNIIYNNREMKRVIRENLNTYEIVTEPTDECITRPMIELFLLSENQLFISDYNAHNHSYRYEDLPVIVEESPSVEYYELSRKAKVTCIVADKFKNKRTYF